MRSTRRARLILVLLLVTAGTLVALDVAGGAPFAGLRSAAGAVFGPIESAVGGITHPIGDFFGGIGSDSHGQVAKLRRQNKDLHRKLSGTAGMRRELVDLKGLTGLAGEGGFRIVAARVVALGSAGAFEWTATIDAGSADGVHPGMTVMNGDGLVGKTERVHAHTATVLLAIDAKAHVGARLESSGQAGATKGNGLDGLAFTLFDSNIRLHRGERIVTLGPGDAKPYVAGLPIGTITKVESTPGALTRTAHVKPFVDFTSLSAVGVVVHSPSKPRKSLLPPKPKHSARPGQHSGSPAGRGGAGSGTGKS